MSKRSIRLSFLVVLAVLFMAIGWVGAQDATMVLKDTETFKGLQRPPVTFTHEKHAELYPDCVQCHHDYEYKDGKKQNTWSGDGQSCSQCHKLNQTDKKLPLRAAFHDNCTGCHRDLVKESKKSGPVTCGECHVRGK